MSIEYLSFSGAQSYGNCPAQFAHKRIWKTQIPEAPPSDPIIIGNNFHASIQKEAEENTPIDTASNEAQETYHALIDIWEGSDNERRLEEISSKKMIPEFEFFIKHPPLLFLRGFIDIVAIDENGVITIVEIKTGSKPYPKKYMTQLDLYVAGWNFMSERKLHPYPKAQRKALIMATTKEPRKIIMREYDLTDEERDSKVPLYKMERYYKSITKAVKDDNFPKEPSFLCNWCDFVDVCKPYGSLHNLGK